MKKTISLTEAARNFSECINRAHYQNVTFVLLKSGSPVARIVPDRERVCTGRNLAAALEAARLLPDEARAWNEDLRAARAQLKPLADKWRKRKGIKGNRAEVKCQSARRLAGKKSNSLRAGRYTNEKRPPSFSCSAGLPTINSAHGHTQQEHCDEARKARYQKSSRRYTGYVTKNQIHSETAP